MGIMVRSRAQYHEAGLMEVQGSGVQQSGFDGSEQLRAEPRLPSGWEKCLDLKSGLIYFKDWNSGTLTYRDPRQQQSVPQATQRIGLLSISLSSPEESLRASSEDFVSTKRKTTDRIPSAVDEQSLELSLNLPGTPSTPRPDTSQDGSVCTMEKVRNALERSQWLHSRTRLVQLPKKNRTNSPSSDPTTLSLLSSSSTSPSCSRMHLDSRSKSESAATSPCSSECFTSPSVMSFQGDDEEVQQPGECRDSGAKSPVDSSEAPGSSPVMVTVGCKSCLMYVMLSKAHPSCPKCGNTDVLLELPAPLPKKQRTTAAARSPSWSWSTA